MIVAIIGCGALGRKIAGFFCAFGGVRVHVYDQNENALLNLRAIIESDIAELTNDGIIDPPMLTFSSDELNLTSSLEETVRDADFIFEAVPDNLNLKQQIMQKITSECPSTSILSTNSLNLEIDDIFLRASSKERTIGIRFLYPVYYIPEVEINTGRDTSMITVQRVREFLEGMGKVLFLRNARSQPLVLSPHQITERKLAAIEAVSLHRMQARARLIPSAPEIELNVREGSGPSAAGPAFTHPPNSSPARNQTNRNSQSNAPAGAGVVYDNIFAQFRSAPLDLPTSGQPQIPSQHTFNPARQQSPSNRPNQEMGRNSPSRSSPVAHFVANSSSPQALSGRSSDGRTGTGNSICSNNLEDCGTVVSSGSGTQVVSATATAVTQGSASSTGGVSIQTANACQGTGAPRGEHELCCVCMERARNAVLLPCGHVCVCVECAARLRARSLSCPICRSMIDTSIRIYLT